MLSMVEKILSDIDERITVHDFRYVKGVTHTNLIFDIVLPFENKTPISEIKAQISEKIMDVNPSYNAIITVDRG